MGELDNYIVLTTYRSGLRYSTYRHPDRAPSQQFKNPLTIYRPPHSKAGLSQGIFRLDKNSLELIAPAIGHPTYMIRPLDNAEQVSHAFSMYVRWVNRLTEQLPRRQTFHQLSDFPRPCRWSRSITETRSRKLVAGFPTYFWIKN